ncbi:MAG: hypothetical protein ACRDCT_00545, partial [Shewanella sp.]
PIIHLPESTEPKIGQQPGFHFTIPIMGSPATTEVQITSLSADNRCQPAAWFPFLDTDNAVSSGY